MAEYQDEKNMIDIGTHTDIQDNDSSDDIVRMAGDFAKAAGGLASSFGKFAAKKSSELKDKLDDDDLQEKISSGIKTITNKIDDYVASDSEIDRKIINVKGIIDIEEPESESVIKAASEPVHKNEPDRNKLKFVTKRTICKQIGAKCQIKKDSRLTVLRFPSL